MRNRAVFWSLALGVLALDLATKQWALAALEPGIKKPLIGDAISLQLVFNPGAAFSLGASSTLFFTIFSAIAVILILWFARKPWTRTGTALLALVWAGAAGNLFDRLFREPGLGRGKVVDMINYFDWFIGNVADIAVVGAAVAFVICSLFGRQLMTEVETAPLDEV